MFERLGTKSVSVLLSATVGLTACSSLRSDHKVLPTPPTSSECPATRLPNLKPAESLSRGEEGRVFMFAATSACRQVTTYDGSQPFPYPAEGQLAAAEPFRAVCVSDDKPASMRIVSMTKPVGEQVQTTVLLDKLASDSATAHNIPVCPVPT